MSPFSRRDFVALSTAATFTAKSYSQVAGSNNKLKIGVIGCGGMGTEGHMKPLVKVREQMNFEFAAVCDIYTPRADRAAQLTGAQKKYRDYRQLLADKDVDYVLIATPEHWHAQMSMDAAEAGKHIYCEKPMTYNVQEARKVVDTINRTKVKMQVGVQGMSDDSYETANKYVKDGTLGKVVLAQIDYSRNSLEPDFLFTGQEKDFKPEPGVNLDWNAWQGQAKKHPFDPNRFFNWRRYWDYSSGIASDLFIHRVTRIIKSCGLTFPQRGVSLGGKYSWPDAIGDVPDTMNMLLEYPEGMTVQLVSSMANSTPIEHMLRGHKATLTFNREGFVIRPEGPFRKDMQEITHKKSGAESTVLHHKNLQNAIRNNEALKCDCNLGYYGVAAAGMGTEAYKRQRYMGWDKAKERFVKL
ncbi:MAG: Gfo/Idh/MocA family oxidoreductase [Bryobacterales bacterium]|nr:Gfo/Idh/MocA family oxidoreductase [Bryobacterales bacterium]